MEKTKPNTTKARIYQSKEMYYNTQKKTKKQNKNLKPCLVALNDIRPGNEAYSYFSIS